MIVKKRHKGSNFWHTPRKYEARSLSSDVALDRGGGDAGIIPQAGAITDLGVEYLTSGEGFVLLDVLDDFERHKVVATPRNVREIFVNDSRHNINVLTEDCS